MGLTCIILFLKKDEKLFLRNMRNPYLCRPEK